jgi:acyl-homoserine lactone synthase
MLAIVDARNQQLYKHDLDEMFQLRHRIVVDTWGWKIPGAGNGRESDAFDTDETIYFLAFDDDGDRVVGCGRLIPTTGPHLFSEVFPYACDLTGVRRGETIFELSRYIIDTDLARRDYARAAGSLEFAFTKYCLAAGITHLTWFSSDRIYQHALSFWDTRPLGLPAYREEDGQTCIAAISAMNEKGLERIRRKYAFTDADPVLALRHPWTDAEHLFGARHEPAPVRPAA